MKQGRGAPKNKYNRWHRFSTITNEKEVKCFPVGFDATIMNEDGYTGWKPGNGPLSPEQYENLMREINIKVRGVPKSPETKEKMRMAQLGKPKSPEHRKAMSIARYRVLAK